MHFASRDVNVNVKLDLVWNECVHFAANVNVNVKLDLAVTATPPVTSDVHGSAYHFAARGTVASGV